MYLHYADSVIGAWCCSTDDGNSWFGDKYFDVTKWKRGLEFMAKRVSNTINIYCIPYLFVKGKTWGSMTSMSMRNELRSPDDNTTLVNKNYNWANWYPNVVAASKIINAANPDTLIFFSGMGFDTTLQSVVTGASLGNGLTFKKGDFSYSNKIVMELHNYQNSATSCSSIQSTLQSGGFSTLTAASENQYPMVMTEYGFDQTDTSYKGVYATCLQSYLPKQHVGWTLWAVAGSYYIRDGTQDYDETWGKIMIILPIVETNLRLGLYNHNWTGWRAVGIDNLKTMVKATLG